jgi:hypothetical protein
LEDAKARYSKDSAAPQQVVLTPVAKDILKHVITLGWPKGSESQLPEVISQSHVFSHRIKQEIALTISGSGS